jgi:hypothetical protein
MATQAKDILKGGIFRVSIYLHAFKRSTLRSWSVRLCFKTGAETIKKEGIIGLYRGVGISAVRPRNYIISV